MNKRHLTYLAGLLLSLPAQAQDMTGAWRLHFAMDAIADNERVLHVTQDGTRLAGSLVGDAGRSPVTGSIDGDDFDIEFAPHPGGAFTLTVQGTIDADTLTGWTRFGDEEIAVSGRRLAADAHHGDNPEPGLLERLHSRMRGSH